MNTQDLTKSLPPTPGSRVPSSSTLKPTTHHERVAEVPNVSQPPGIARGDKTRPRDPETEDLGWSEDPRVPIPVVEGINNEHLWILVRRFNKQVFHLRRISDPPPGILDCTSAATSDSYSPDRIRSALERLYLTIIVDVASALKHIARIRSWTETSRTAWFCTIYFVSWYQNLLVPMFLVFLLTLVLFPSARPKLFPPAPLAAIDSKTGQVQKPVAGSLGSKDSMTGAEEQFKGEAVEREADTFVTELSSIAVSVAVGKEGSGAGPTQNEEHDQSLAPSINGSSVDAKIPDVADVTGAVGAQRAASTTGDISEKNTKQTAMPMKQAMWDNIGFAMAALGTMIDLWEMTGNALTSRPPFRSLPVRIRLASPIALMFLISLVVPEVWIYQCLTFSIGVGLFGQPIFDKLAQKNFVKVLDRVLGTQWRKYLDVRNTILLGAPTDNQLTLTLLRLGEANKSPLPPPPLKATSDSNISSPPPTAHIGDLPPEYSEQVLEVHASASSPSQSSEDDGTDSDPDDNPADNNSTKPKRSAKLLKFVKSTTKAGVSGVLGLDKAKATMGSKSAKARTGIVKPVVKVEEAQREDGPSVFRAKWKGHEGALTLSTGGTQALVAFSRLPRLGIRLGHDVKEKEVLENPADTVVWSLAIDDIREVRKVGGFGWKGKMVVGWSTGDRVIDGLEITDMKGTVYFITALPRRDEVFNRLVAIGRQRWESC